MAKIAMEIDIVIDIVKVIFPLFKLKMYRYLVYFLPQILWQKVPNMCPLLPCCLKAFYSNKNLSVAW
jgi:hypothetical protein